MRRKPRARLPNSIQDASRLVDCDGPPAFTDDWRAVYTWKGRQRAADWLFGRRSDDLVGATADGP
jgi:hypothetical protein